MKKIVIVGALLGSGLLLTGCGLENIAAADSEEVVDYEITEKVAELRVRSGSGEIVVSETDRSGIRVTETMHWRGDDKPKTKHPVVAETVTLSYDCPTRVGWNSCSVDYKVEVPKTMKVDVETGSGTITLRALTGQLTANTGSGDIEAGSLGSKKAFAETGSGNVTLKFTTAPEDVELETGSGDAAVTVPDGSYAVSTETGSGEERVEVTNEKSAPNKLVLTTGSGDASVLKS
ncbi:DUF4097 family beta strand repeat-containing protein [Streptosporangium soli]|nr:DUF4097 family beta strand repeat-containing protein [Streptosporangium sp. KLBMP 9127]